MREGGGATVVLVEGDAPVFVDEELLGRVVE
jgi:hypothetical protein